MKKIYLFLLCVSVFAISANAQVTIGSTAAPVQGAVLELKSDTLGFLPPRVVLVALNDPAPIAGEKHVEGMVVYNLPVNLPEGLYYNDGTKWVRLSIASKITEKWFYMPSIVIPIPDSYPSETLTINLYEKFLEQLSADLTSTGVVSNGAPAIVLSTVPAATELNYYVTKYDQVFQIDGIDEYGTMTYKVLEPATDETILNIVFVEK